MKNKVILIKSIERKERKLSPKILYMELLDNNYGNKRFDIEIIKILIKFADVTVAYPDGWFEVLPDEVNKIVYKKSDIISNNRLSNYCCHWNLLKIAKDIDKEKRFDYLFFASYHSVVMAFAKLMFKNTNRVYVVNHNNIDNVDQSRKLKKWFKLYCKSINHIVYEPFIASHLMDFYKIPEEKIFVLPHPLNEVINRQKEKKYNCVGISNSNDEVWISEIVENEKHYETIKKNHKHVVLRSKTQQYNNGYLKVINHYLSDEEYYDYISNTEVLFLPFSNTFKYRMSGSLVDAFSNDTKIIATKIPLFVVMEKQYPEICRTVSSSKELLNYINEESNFDGKMFEHFKKEHSEQRILTLLKKEFGGK